MSAVLEQRGRKAILVVIIYKWRKIVPQMKPTNSKTSFRVYWLIFIRKGTDTGKSLQSFSQPLRQKIPHSSLFKARCLPCHELNSTK